jgi:hypothetical protein
MATTYPNFDSFAQAVRNLRLANPEWVRLNGEAAGGDRNAWSYFVHAGKTWKVDADSHILPIIVAHEHFQQTGIDPFALGNTPTREKLTVSSDVQHKLVQQDEQYRNHSHLYIYAKK